MSKDKKSRRTEYWRSLDHLHDSPSFQAFQERMHYHRHTLTSNAMSRRNFMTLMGASMALAGLAGCRRPVDKIVPYVSQPEEITPGVAAHYATSMPRGNSALGLIVNCREGRPTKIEGNPDHPASLGATDMFAQAEILNLYDPDRSRHVLNEGAKSKYEDFVSFWREQLERYQDGRGAGLAVLAEESSSPTLARYRREFTRALPDARWVTYEPISDENILAATEQVTDNRLELRYDYGKADIVVALDNDFLMHESGSVLAARQFAERRRVSGTDDDMNRLYVVESGLTVTGSNADHRMRLPSSEIGPFAVALAQELRKQGLELNGLPTIDAQRFDQTWLRELAKDILANREKSIIAAGRRQPAWVHGLLLIINEAMGNWRKTVTFSGLIGRTISDTSALRDLTAAMNQGQIDTLVILGGNPVYNAPADLKFADAVKKVTTRIHFGAYVDESADGATWHIPRAHFLESWGDAISADITHSVVQPMIEPLFGAHADCEMLALLATGRDQRGYDIVRETWEALFKNDFEAKWRRVLHDGLQAGSADKVILKMTRGNLREVMKNVDLTPQKLSASGLEVNFVQSNVADGRYANNGWLQELPDPITKLAWDNAAILSPKTANDLNIVSGDLIQIQFDGRSLEIAAWITPGFADNTITLPLGYGRRLNGRVADGVGFDTYALRSTGTMHFGIGATVTKTGRTYVTANTQDHNTMAGRPIVREATLEQYRKHPRFAEEAVEHPPLENMYPPHDYSQGYQWGMVIDLNACIGCGACTVACQSENNIPIVGKEQVEKGREMHWLRIDRYFGGDENDPAVYHQPVPCQHCENAPCETVCPVAATVHDREGLNNMTYNRCIGTRYCSNNCPYKVRRFNFFNYTSDMPELSRMAQNPDVTVRSRGVMEKCTFCLQRINAGKARARLEGRTVADHEIQTACQQVCPTKAIEFGNINEAESRVSRLKQRDRNYNLLAEFNVRPRNSYLAGLRNPNPALQAKPRHTKKKVHTG